MDSEMKRADLAEARCELLRDALNAAQIRLIGHHELGLCTWRGTCPVCCPVDGEDIFLIIRRALLLAGEEEKNEF